MAPWSRRKTLLFVIVTCGAFWGAAGYCLYRVLQ